MESASAPPESPVVKRHQVGGGVPGRLSLEEIQRSVEAVASQMTYATKALGAVRSLLVPAYQAVQKDASVLRAEVEMLKERLASQQKELDKEKNSKLKLQEAIKLMTTSSEEDQKTISSLRATSKTDANKLEELEGRLQNVIAAADAMLPGVGTRESEERPKSLSPLVKSTIEVLVDCIVELFGKASNLHEVTSLAAGASDHMLSFLKSAAFEGARDVLAMLKAHYPATDMSRLIRFEASVEPTTLYGVVC